MLCQALGSWEVGFRLVDRLSLQGGGASPAFRRTGEQSLSGVAGRVPPPGEFQRRLRRCSRRGAWHPLRTHGGPVRRPTCLLWRPYPGRLERCLAPPEELRWRLRRSSPRGARHRPCRSGWSARPRHVSPVRPPQIRISPPLIPLDRHQSAPVARAGSRPFAHQTPSRQEAKGRTGHHTTGRGPRPLPWGLEVQLAGPERAGGWRRAFRAAWWDSNPRVERWGPDIAGGAQAAERGDCGARCRSVTPCSRPRKQR